MTKRNEIYKVVDSANNSMMVEVLIPSDGALACGTPMVENTTDAAREKHVPVVQREFEYMMKVTVGSTPHPMTEEHHIDFIYVETENGGIHIKTKENPNAKFCIQTDKPVMVYDYCNLHGLWNTDV